MSNLIGSDANRTIYVSTAGDDAASGGATTPLRTLAKAVSLIPEVIRANHFVNIKLLDGEWAEDLKLPAVLVLGRLVISGNKGNRSAVKVRSVSGHSILGRVEIYGVTTTRKDASGPSFHFTRSGPDIYIDSCHAEGDPSENEATGVIGYLADYGTTMHVRSSSATNKRYAFRSNYNSRMYVVDGDGSGCTFAIGARWGGIIGTYGTRPQAVNSLSSDSAGIVTAVDGIVIPWEGTNYGGNHS